MVFAGQELTLSAGAADEASANEILDVDLDGEDITVAFNPNYLREGLSAIAEPFRVSSSWANTSSRTTTGCVPYS